MTSVALLESHEVDAESTPAHAHDEPAEMGVIVSMFANADLRAQSLALLRADDFYVRKCRILFEAMKAVHDSDTGFDEVSVHSWMRENDRLKEFQPDTMAGFLARFVSSVAAAGHVRAYAQTIRDCARRRAAATLCARFQAELMAEGLEGAKTSYAGIQGQLNRMSESIAKLASDTPASGATPNFEVIDATYAELRRAAEDTIGLRVTTGLRDLDQLTGGVLRTELVVIGALPSVGKTSLMTGIAHHVASQGIHVLFFTMEMTAVDIVMRQAGLMSRVTQSQLRTAGYRENGAELVAALKHLRGLPISWEGRSAGNAAASMPDVLSLLSKAQIAQAWSRAKGWPKIGLVCVDYLQKLTPLPGVKSPVEAATRDIRGLKLLAERIGAPVMVASALNRECSKGDQRKPRMSDMYGGSAIEYEADQIWLMHREKPEQETVDVIVAKNRRAGTGEVTIGFERRYMRFFDLDDMGKEYM